MALSLDTIDIIDPDHYQQNGYPHEEWTLLRREAPLYWFDRTDDDPFWAVTKHEDIVFLSRQPKRFLLNPRLAVFPDFQPPEAEDPDAHHLLTMDPPEHGDYRRLVSSAFTPRAIRARAPEIERIAVDLLDGIQDKPECDFVREVSAILPLAAIADILGLPRSDWELMFRWTNEIVGSNDPEYTREGMTPEETSESARLELFAYFMEMVEERRKDPKDDILSLLGNAKLDGQDLPVRELLSFFFLLVVAGNETTRNATSGGLLAMIENPDQLALLRDDPSLVQTAVEEIVRWTTPVIQFCRTSTEDFEMRGQKIREGDAFCLFYASANRDEDIHEDPFAFRVDRKPNPHLGFGIGEHFCLGANLARLELQLMFKHLSQRMQEVELAGPVERLRSSFLGGVKHMPIRYRMKTS
jgi:cholest-4-en-3-one 26-monooxygenase